ncbi:MAG: YidC/Oxa1 family membrane protein insertase, partial [Kofleriaceae bacterium]
DPYHILPVILVVTMFLQARMTPATGDSRQQKFLQYGMPLMFGVMSFFFPSGLTLYIFTNTVLSALHSIYMNKYDKQSLALAAKMKAAKAEAEAAAAAGAKSAGKGAAKPTKPSAAKPIIDVESSETEGDDEGSTSGSPTSTPRPQGNRAKRKKRRR